MSAKTQMAIPLAKDTVFSSVTDIPADKLKKGINAAESSSLSPDLFNDSPLTRTELGRSTHRVTYPRVWSVSPVSLIGADYPFLPASSPQESLAQRHKERPAGSPVESPDASASWKPRKKDPDEYKRDRIRNYA